MTDVMKVAAPKFASGPVQGQDLTKALSVFQRDVLARMDVRYPDNDFNAGLVSSGTGVTLGAQAIPAGRTVGVPTLVNKITDIGTAQDQRFLPQVSAGNKLSIQSVLPLSATSDASTSTINIASHTLQYGYGTVAYSSGSISGLTPNTNYYVYADDPSFAGGAVSYQATTNPQTVTANNGRYYVGSIVTAISATVVNISAATSANPIAMTTGAAHGFTSGDNVSFAALPGDFGTHLNGTTQVVTVTGSTSFTIAVNGSAFATYTSGGTATRVTTPTGGGGGGGGGGAGRPLV